MTKIQKILFINPPDPSLMTDTDAEQYDNYFEPPIGLLYVYNYIKNRNEFELKLLDLNIEIKFLTKRKADAVLADTLGGFKPDLVGISALYYSGIDIFHLLAKKIKQIRPETLVVLGGHYPTHLTEICLTDVNVDYLVLSEGELGFSDLIDGLNGKRNLDEVEGIAFKRNGALLENPRKNFWSGFVDEVRLPWEDTHFSYYFKEGRNVLYRVKDRQALRLAAITASRGCPHRCSFCTSPSFWGQHWRHRKVTNIVAEIQFLKDTYDVNTIIFNDENISVNRKWFLEFLDALKTLRINWISSGGLSPRAINSETVIQKMYASGIVLFNLAIESGSNRTLKKVHKRLSTEETENAIRLIRRFGKAYITGFFITGFPFEKLCEAKQTLEFANSLDLDWKCFYCFQPFPGSELFDYCQENHLMEDFDPNYKEVYFAPALTYPDYTAEHLDELNYLENLKCNFLLNRNILLKTRDSLAQAKRDFYYVLEMVPEHVFAYLGLAEIMRIHNEISLRKNYIVTAKAILATDSFNWGHYLTYLGIDIDTL